MSARLTGLTRPHRGTSRQPVTCRACLLACCQVGVTLRRELSGITRRRCIPEAQWWFDGAVKDRIHISILSSADIVCGTILDPTLSISSYSIIFISCTMSSTTQMSRLQEVETAPPLPATDKTDKVATKPQRKRPILVSFRSSTTFITFVISYVVFTEQFLFIVITPVEPFVITERVKIPQS
jgi:hypothetical protein